MNRDELFEKNNFSKTIEIIHEQIELQNDYANRKEKSIIESKKEMMGETSHSIGSLANTEDYEQLIELSQFATMISNDISSYEDIIKKIKQLKMMLLSPYFARIDFEFDNEDDVENIYIGRFSLMEKHRIVVYDWRSPIAGMFYRYGLGEASYEAPMGMVLGKIKLKRQYEIAKGVLEYFFDAEIEILDEFLREILSKNASMKMKSIVETIQRDQDTVIRDLENQLLIVQGAAGSGKTSIALHRVAYLMYSGLNDRLTNQHIVIISPNSLFEQYISKVLPELGEENVNSFLIDEILKEVLKTSKIQTKNNFLEKIMMQEQNIMRKSIEFKTSKEFMAILDKIDIREKDIIGVVESYINLFCNKYSFSSLAKGVSLPEEINEIFKYTQENLQCSYLFFDDAAAITYLYLKNVEYNNYRHIKQVVVDEAQDYYPMHFEIFNMMFPKARYTILSDINQTIGKSEDLTFYDGIKNIFSKEKSSVVTLDKSFRCTNEILNFSSRFVETDIKVFGRDGDEPIIYEMKSKFDLDNLVKEIEICQEKGYRTVGIICKTEKDCLELYKKLSKDIEVEIINSSSVKELNGVFILPIYMSKGLEFDVSLIWEVDKNKYNTEYDRNLLYIGCTRALHRLGLFYHGEISPLFEEKNK